MLAQTALQHQLEEQREALEKERHRVTSLCSRFEGSIATFSERHQEELRNLQESQARANTLRDIVEQQRMQHAKEVHKEMLALESRRSELDEERYKWLQEVQQQRLDLSKEKNELTRLMERVRIEERDAHDTKIAAQEATSEMSAERQELNEKRKFTESEYRRLEEYRAEATRRFEEEAGVVEREKRRLELVMAKVEEESERALQLRRDAAADRQFIEQTKQQFEVQKRSQDEERRDLNAIKKRIDFEKSQRPSLPPRKGDGDRRVALRAVGNHPKGPFKDVIPSAFQKLHVDPENIAVGPQYLGITGRTSPLVPRAGGLSLIGSTSAANEEDDIVQEQRSFLLSLASPEDFA
ncbi:Flagellar attachment zone protein 1 [Diplonema papillatum]|nr:Flagellar attachment zone protein 1 [Diplonema papillatum]